MKPTKPENHKKIPTRHALVLTLSLVTMFASQLALAAENESYKKEIEEIKQTSSEIIYEMPKTDFHDEIEAAIAQVEHQAFLAEQARIAEERREAEQKAEKERLEREKEEKARLAAEKAERERKAADKAEQARLAAQKAEKERMATTKAISEKPTVKAAKTESSPSKTTKVAAASTFSATYYTATCKGCSGITAGGTDVRGTIYKSGMRVIAVDPSVIPLGTIVRVTTPHETFTAVADDKGGAIKGKKIDILVSTVGEALSKGRHDVQIEILD